MREEILYFVCDECENFIEISKSHYKEVENELINNTYCKCENTDRWHEACDQEIVDNGGDCTHSDWEVIRTYTDRSDCYPPGGIHISVVRCNVCGETDENWS